MATKSSGELSTSETYTLGEYRFNITKTTDTHAGKTIITAKCLRDGDNQRQANKVVDGENVDITNWYVEANDTTADVYATIKKPLIYGSVNTAASGSVLGSPSSYTLHEFVQGPGVLTINGEIGGSTWQVMFASSSPSAVGKFSNPNIPDGPSGTYTLSNSYTFNQKTAYYFKLSLHWISDRVTTTSISPKTDWAAPDGVLAYFMVYNERPYKEETVLVGRFAISVEEAGGTGTDSNWDDPVDWYDHSYERIEWPGWEDYDLDPDDFQDWVDDGNDPEEWPDWPDDEIYDDYVDWEGEQDEEEEEAQKLRTLSLAVTGASAGSHSATPAENTAQKFYGCGGDGGHGGGGGAGASSVVVYKFATDKADSKEITTTTRPPGSGSKGGKGGTGGDGCILIYY